MKTKPCALTALLVLGCLVLMGTPVVAQEHPVAALPSAACLIRPFRQREIVAGMLAVDYIGLPARE